MCVSVWVHRHFLVICLQVKHVKFTVLSFLSPTYPPKIFSTVLCKFHDWSQLGEGPATPRGQPITHTRHIRYCYGLGKLYVISFLQTVDFSKFCQFFISYPGETSPPVSKYEVKIERKNVNIDQQLRCQQNRERKKRGRFFCASFKP